MLGHGIPAYFCMRGVYCSIDFQPVRIRLYLLPSFFVFFFAPAEQICFPVERILLYFTICQPRCPGFIGLLGIQHTNAGIHGNTLQDLRYGLRDGSMAMPATNPRSSRGECRPCNLVRHHITANVRYNVPGLWEGFLHIPTSVAASSIFKSFPVRNRK